MKALLLLFRLCAVFLPVSGWHAQAEAKKAEAAEEGPATAMFDGKKIFTKDAEEVQGAIVGELFKRFGDEQKIEATKEERASYHAWSQWMRAERTRQEAARTAEFNKALEFPGLNAEEKNEIAHGLEVWRNKDDIFERAPDENFDNQMADHFILHWKLNAAFYKQYGGGVIFQQFGLEPVEAYREYLREQEKKGVFAIYDEDIRRKFWEYFTGNTRYLDEDDGAAHFAALPFAPPGKDQPKRRDSPEADADHAQFLLQLARKRQWAEQHDAAIELTTWAIALFPKDGDAYRLRAVSQAKKKEPERELADIRRAVEVEPRDANHHLVLARALAERGKVEEAGQALDEAVKVEPKYVPARVQRSKHLLAKRALAEADADLEVALKQKAGDGYYADEDGGSQPERATIYRLVGAVRWQMKDYAAAVKAFTEAVEKGEQFRAALLGRAEARAALGDEEGAAADRKAAARLKPGK